VKAYVLFKALKARKGSVTIEFVFLIPLFIFMALFLWQVALAGLAVIQTESALRDAVRVAAVTGDVNKARQQAYSSFGSSANYNLSKVNVSINDDQAVATATTEIHLLFLKSQSISYTDSARAPVID
jgi:Flp pilus assembly protein TadG